MARPILWLPVRAGARAVVRARAPPRIAAGDELRALAGPLRLALLAARLVRRRGRDALRDLVRTAACRLAALDVLVLTLPLGALDPTWRHQLSPSFVPAVSLGRPLAARHEWPARRVSEEKPAKLGPAKTTEEPP